MQFSAAALYGAQPLPVPSVTTSREQLAVPSSAAARRADPEGVVGPPSGDPVLVFVVVAALAVLLGYASVSVSVGKK